MDRIKLGASIALAPFVATPAQAGGDGARIRSCAHQACRSDDEFWPRDLGHGGREARDTRRGRRGAEAESGTGNGSTATDGKAVEAVENRAMKDQVLEALCRMPVEFRRRRDIGLVYLLEESGYPEEQERILESDIEAYLRAHPELVDSWVGESDDQRTSPAWCLIPPSTSSNKRGIWAIWYVAPPNPPIERTYSDPFVATAAYIKRYADWILENRGWSPPTQDS